MVESLPRNSLDYLKYKLLETFSTCRLVLSIDNVDFLSAGGLALFAFVGKLELGYHGRVDILEGGIVSQLLEF